MGPEVAEREEIDAVNGETERAEPVEAIEAEPVEFMDEPGPTEAIEADGETAGSTQLVPVGPSFMLDPYCLMQAQARPLTFEQWARAAETLRKVDSSIRWWIGDMLNIGDSLFGEEASQVIDHEKWSEQTVKNFCWVAKNVAPSNRAIGQSWSHCQVVAALTTSEQRRWLKESAQQGWTVSKLKTEIMAALAGGKAKLKFWLIVNCENEGKQTKLAERLEVDGFTVLRKSGLKRDKAPKKVKEKGITARKRRAGKMTTRRRKG